MRAIVLTAVLVLSAAGSAPADDRVPEEFRSAPVDRRPATLNPEGSWRGKVVRLTTYPAGEALRFEVVLSPAFDDAASGRRLSSVTVYTDLMPQLRVHDWLLVRGKQFCIRPEASGKLESGHLSGIWEVTLDDRDPERLLETARAAPPFTRAPGVPECSKTL